MASEEDLAEMTARRCQYECKTMNDDEYKRIKVIIATAITAARAEQREKAAKVAEDDTMLCEINSTQFSARGTASRIAAAIRAGKE